MFRDDKLILEIDEHEQGVVINALRGGSSQISICDEPSPAKPGTALPRQSCLDYRTAKLSEGYTTDIIDELLIKTIEAPTKKEKRRNSVSRGEAR